jgi:serine kinase of HPr protein (carbohydrate metabolism regulator)
MSESIHATAVLVGAAGVLIRGDSGSGKSALALALIRRGGRLVADDRLTLSRVNGRLVATAAHATAGLIELRGRGVIRVPHERSAVIRLLVDIVKEEGLERMPDSDQLTATLLGIRLDRQPVPPALDRALVLVETAVEGLRQRPGKGLANDAGLGMMAALPNPTASL